MAPFGFISDGLDAESFVSDDGDRWYASKSDAFDEYGVAAGGWELWGKY
jgi:hypothetical protein